MSDLLVNSRRPPAGFLDLRKVLFGGVFQINYSTPSNFTGAVLPGYGAPGAWLLEEAASRLAAVQRALLFRRGITLIVYDAYRPVRATLAMYEWAIRNGKLHLFEQGYIARHSGHNHGHTVDVTLARADTGTLLDMGCPWDTLNESANTDNATGDALANRHLLRDSMMAEGGFTPYPKEWWHFTLMVHGTRPRDVPYGLSESEEGAA